MKKYICAAVAAILITCCAVSCGKKDDAKNDSSSTSSSDSAAETTTAENEAVNEMSDISEGAEDVYDYLADNYEQAEPIDIIPDEKTEADFLGKWECTKFVAGGYMIEDTYMSIPVSATLRIEVLDDHTAKLTTGIAPEDAIVFNWEYAENTLTLTEADTGDGTESSEGSDEEFKQHLAIMGDDCIFYMSDSTEDYYYLKKVDEYSEFSMEDFYNALGIDSSSLDPAGEPGSGAASASSSSEVTPESAAE